MSEDREPKTAGIPPATGRFTWGADAPLAVLQFADVIKTSIPTDQIRAAAREVSIYHPPVGNQAQRHAQLSGALEAFLTLLVLNCPPGPERSTAISRAREAKMWASAAIALER